MSDPIKLSTLLGGVLASVQEANHLADIETGKLIEAYVKDRLLAQAAVPAYTITDLELELRFAIVGTGGPGPGVLDLMVVATSADLKDMNPGQIQAMHVKLSPLMVRPSESPQS